MCPVINLLCISQNQGKVYLKGIREPHLFYRDRADILSMFSSSAVQAFGALT